MGASLPFPWRRARQSSAGRQPQTCARARQCRQHPACRRGGKRMRACSCRPWRCLCTCTPGTLTPWFCHPPASHPGTACATPAAAAPRDTCRTADECRENGGGRPGRVPGNTLENEARPALAAHSAPPGCAPSHLHGCSKPAPLSKDAWATPSCTGHQCKGECQGCRDAQRALRQAAAAAGGRLQTAGGRQRAAQ